MVCGVARSNVNMGRISSRCSLGRNASKTLPNAVQFGGRCIPGWEAIRKE